MSRDSGLTSQPGSVTPLMKVGLGWPGPPYQRSINAGTGAGSLGEYCGSFGSQVICTASLNDLKAASCAAREYSGRVENFSASRAKGMKCAPRLPPLAA